MHTGGVINHDRIRQHIQEDVAVTNPCQIILAQEVDPEFSDLLALTATRRHVRALACRRSRCSFIFVGRLIQQSSRGGGWVFEQTQLRGGGPRSGGPLQQLVPRGGG